MTTDTETSAAHGNALDQASREELSIGKAINRAARDLPEGWEIRIDLERYAGAVFLIYPDGNETMSENAELFSDQINAAIDAAMKEDIRWLKSTPPSRRLQSLPAAARLAPYPITCRTKSTPARAARTAW